MEKGWNLTPVPEETRSGFPSGREAEEKGTPRDGGRLRGRAFLDRLFAVLTGGAAFSVCVLLLGILAVLLDASSLSIERFGLLRFVFSTEWNPVEESFGAATSLFGTAATTVFALSLAIPVALGIAVFLTEVAPRPLRGGLGMALELLAAIPSIVFGMWGLFTLAPIMAGTVEPALQGAFGNLPLVGRLFEGTPLGIDLFTAAVVLSIMIIPFTASIARDAFNLTPALVKESAYGLGATKWEVVRDVVLPHARMGVFGGIVLSMGRAIGETMAVAFVLGNNHQIPSSLLDGATSITVTLANEFTEADGDLYLSSLFHLALILFVFSFVVLATAKLFILRARRRQGR